MSNGLTLSSAPGAFVRIGTPAPSEWVIDTPRRYNFTPQEDITPLESAWCAHFFVWFSAAPFAQADKHPQWRLIERHFTEGNQ